MKAIELEEYSMNWCLLQLKLKENAVFSLLGCVNLGN